MSDYYNKLSALIQQRFSAKLDDCFVEFGQVTVVLKNSDMIEVLTALRDEADFACEELIDLCGVDYSDYAGWQGQRYAVAYQLLSVKNNHRIRVRVMTDGEPPRVESVINVWSSADWFEREAFDLYGIVFDGHPDLRRILTDYGFVGHPFRKDFPLIGNVEMRYDADKKRVIYQPVSIEPRINQPRVIRDDHRYASRQSQQGEHDA